MPELSELESRVREVIAEQMGLEEGEVGLDSDFIKDLGADSLDIVELIMAMEEEFNLEISDEEAEKIRKVHDVVAYLQKKQA